MRKRVLFLFTLALMCLSIGTVQARQVPVNLNEEIRIELDTASFHAARIGKNVGKYSTDFYQYVKIPAFNDSIAFSNTAPNRLYHEVWNERLGRRMWVPIHGPQAWRDINYGDTILLAKVARINVLVKKDDWGKHDEQANALIVDSLFKDRGASRTIPIFYFGGILPVEGVLADFNELTQVTKSEVFSYEEKVTDENGKFVKDRKGKYKTVTKRFTLYYTLRYDASTGVLYLHIRRGGSPEAETPAVSSRAVTIMEKEGVTVSTGFGVKRVGSGNDFSFSVAYADGNEREIRTGRVFNGVDEVLKGTKNENGEYEYVIESVNGDIELVFGEVVQSSLSIEAAAVWASGNVVYLNLDAANVVNVYGVTGQLVKQVVLPSGLSTINLPGGIYLVALKGGAVYKVVVR